MYHHVDCVRALLPVSDLLHTTKEGYTAFHISVRTASEECFELLLPLMEDVNVRTVPGVSEHGAATELFNETALHFACEKGQMAMARALLKCGADRMALNSDQRSPLH